MSLSEVAIRRPVFAWMLMAALVLFGGIAFFRMGISQLPDVDFPVINIGLSLQNAAPEVMENDVVDPVEDAVMGIEGIRSVSSTSSQGQARVTVEFELGRNVDVALQEVQTRIAQAQKSLPQQMEPPVVTKTNPEDLPILWIMLTADASITRFDQMIYARNTLKDRVSTVSGVGNVVFGGYNDPNLRVRLSPERLKLFDLSADDVANAISSEQLELPAGRLENNQKEFNVRLLGEAANPRDFGKIQILQRSGAPNYRPIDISEVAMIEEGLSEIRAISRFNGKPAVGLGIVKQRGSNAVKVAEGVRARVDQIKSTLPKGFQVNVQMDGTRFIQESVSELNFTLLLSALLTSVVCFLFLASWSSTINVLFSIPTSIVGAFIFLYFCGFTLNTFTLLGLSLAIGIVVDDAIMMLENIIRYQEMGYNRVKAAILGSNEITFAALAATIAIAAIFIPVIFMKGVIGRFFYQFGITVTVAVFLSLLEALTLTPMRCSQMGGHQDPHAKPSRLASFVDAIMNRLSRGYKSILHWVLNHWGPVLGSLMTLSLGSLAVVLFMNKELMPAQDQSQFMVVMRTPVGSSIQVTDAAFAEAEKYLQSRPEVVEVFSSIGGYQGQDIVNAGSIYVTLKDVKERKLNQFEIMKEVRKDLSEKLNKVGEAIEPKATSNKKTVEIFVQDLALSGFSTGRGFGIEFSIQGPKWEELVKYSDAFVHYLKDSGYGTDINTDIQSDMPEISIIPNRDAAAARGVTISAMGNAVGTLIGGKIFSSATQYPKSGHRYDIRVRSEEEAHRDPSDILKIQVHNNRGANMEMVPLGSIVKIEERKSLALVTRVNRQRAVQVYANVVEGKSQEEALKDIERFAQKTLAPGYKLNLTGSSQTFRESVSGLLFALLLGIVIAYMVLASQFNSFIHPITVLLALPLSLSGALVSLYVFHQSLNLFSMIGLILLMGIVKKNSILLVDFTNARRAAGESPMQALLSACPVRLRPILMTSIATVAGAIPAAISIGPGSESRIPMAVALIGGVTLSTILTLFVVPCAYLFFVRFERPDPPDQEDELIPTTSPSFNLNAAGVPNGRDRLSEAEVIH